MKRGIVVGLSSVFVSIIVVSSVQAAPSAVGWVVEPLIATPANEMWAVGSPDGAKLAYVSDESGVRSVHIANSDGTGALKISSNTAAVEAVTWGPDSKTLFYTTGDVHMIELNADRTGAVSDSLVTNNGSGWSIPWPSPDGTKLLVPRMIQSSPHGPWHATVWQMDAVVAGGASAEQVGSGPMSNVPT